MGEGTQMLYLSQLMINPRSLQARGDLSDCRALHRRILSAFPDAPDVTAARERYGVLFRMEPLDGGARILVQSRERPDWSRLPVGYLRQPAEPKRVDERYDALVAGQELIFRLRANPTQRIDKRNMEEPERWRGKRVELRKEDQQIAWLERKGKTAGFVLLRTEIARGAVGAVAGRGLSAPQQQEEPVADVRAARAGTKVARYLPGRKVDLAFGQVVFEGRLRITDPVAFRQALTLGIGSGKAFGFGLLSIASPASSVLSASSIR